jgi:hypothetical protein
MVDPQTEEKPTDLKEEETVSTEEPSATTAPEEAPAEPAEPAAPEEAPAEEAPTEAPAESLESADPAPDKLADVDVEEKKEQAAQGSGKFKKRSPILQVILCLFVPFYVIYWILSTNSALRKETDSAVHWILFFIPLVNFFFFWKFFKAVNDVTGYSNGLLFILFILFSPISIYLTQSELNKK